MLALQVLALAGRASVRATVAMAKPARIQVRMYQTPLALGGLGGGA